ncbi:response regulator transcription factor|uniref:DNA-binding response regulator, OmpR family, contains REC and winged-helix (WHTH) domain n=1 Tax=Dendrosporobacter quercicolus TaxID=146817 RepID=A0A1G9KVQ8_9FIRM|nr:two-component system response regulator RppA [Dendrosporobacter quercicolus]NSL46515.1 response regulator transcription factor [Dendrosporobacter quercicolus DSM 1736]SDL53798.1 DNA-binding response regulator, OmpR family, contains REC and winged-helix (wHTH) domain [Dendrosporobacter quercicolus]
MRILIVEDEKNLQQLLKKRLTQSGYGVDAVADGLEAELYLEAAPYDLVVLDWMLPGLDGISLLKRLRQKKQNIPVLLLTAKDSIENRVEGLDAGADDYLVKPFAFDELLARIRVLMRRQTNIRFDTVAVADLTVNFSTRTVARGNKNIVLSSKEFSILEYLIRNQGIVLSREKIEQHIWNYDFESGSNVVNVYIRYLRKKIDDDFEQKLIHTVRGAGYVLQESI